MLHLNWCATKAWRRLGNDNVARSLAYEDICLAAFLSNDTVATSI
jgi:hypothetical protein